VTAADTSIEAYHDLAKSGRLGEQTQEVLKALKALDHPPTINELSVGVLAGWEKSTISGRLNDLKDEGLIHSPGKRADKHTGRKSKIWEVIIQ
jgi:predicted transcriptional regulator